MVLIVEDEAISRRALVQLLRQNGYDAHAVGSAEEALKLVSEGSIPEIALLDIDLPGMSGIDLALQLYKTNPSIVPVFLSATDEERVRNLLRCEPAYFFRKPVDIEGLLGVMGRIEPQSA